MKEQVDREERRSLQAMQKTEAAITDRLRETERLEKSLQFGLDMAKPEPFLQVPVERGFC